MQITAQDFLMLAEQTGQLAFVDIEATGLKGDYNSVLVVSIKPYGKKPVSYAVKRAGDDRAVVMAVKDALESFMCWVTYYGKGFDIPMLNTRCLVHRIAPIEKKHHIDMYFQLKAKTLMARRSQAHLLELLDTSEKKMAVGANRWNEVLADPGKHIPEMTRRCESDVIGLEGLYDRTNHLITDITK